VEIRSLCDCIGENKLISFSSQARKKRLRRFFNMNFVVLPLKFVMDGFVGSCGDGEFERMTRKDEDREQL
jgi:hypothetical protein